MIENEGGAYCNTSNLNDELGQIEFILTDKTGTLTQNLMELRRCTIGNESYEIKESEKLEFNIQSTYFINNPDDLVKYYFFITVALCNDLNPCQSGDTINYRSESTDEVIVFLVNRLL